MPYKLTEEQVDIINTATTASIGTLIKVEAVAGASKSYTLIKIAEALPHTAQLYLAYNKSIADEAKSKFPSYVDCKTTHSLAYNPIIIYGLDIAGNVGKKRTIAPFNYRSFDEDLPYEEKQLLLSHLEAFFLSQHLSLLDYCKEFNIYEDSYIYRILYKYYSAMWNSSIPCTHSFYLKAYHILLANECIHYDRPFDLLMLDECGDINRVTLEIFKLLPANLKIMVGDSMQNIYSFNGTINGFEALSHIGVTKHLSQSFRCSKQIASDIENFCCRYLDSNTVFRGTDHTDTTIRTEAILSRTNSGLISYMIYLSDTDIPFNTTRPVKEIFSLMLILINLKEGCTIYDSHYKYIEKDVTYYYKSKILPTKFKTPLLYIKDLYAEEDRNIKTAISTILKYGASKIYQAYKYAKQCEQDRADHSLTLSTVHSSKGLTFDKVNIASDFDIADILYKNKSNRTKEDIENIRLYYVACSRAKIELEGADCLYI